MTGRRSAISKPKSRRTPPYAAAELMLHEAMAAFRKDMVDEDDPDDTDDEDEMEGGGWFDDEIEIDNGEEMLVEELVPAPLFSPLHNNGTAKHLKPRTTKKFSVDWDSNKPGEVATTFTTETERSDGSWKTASRRSSIPTVINPFTGKPARLSTPRARREPTTTPPALPRSWRTLPPESYNQDYTPTHEQNWQDFEATPSRPAAPSARFPQRDDSLNWKASPPHRIAKTPPTTSAKSPPRRPPRTPPPLPPSTRITKSPPTSAAKSPPRRPARTPPLPPPPLPKRPSPHSPRRKRRSASPTWSTTATLGPSPPSSSRNPWQYDPNYDLPSRATLPLDQRLREAEYTHRTWGGRNAEGEYHMLKRLGKSPIQLAREAGRVYLRGEVEDLVAAPGGGFVRGKSGGGGGGDGGRGKGKVIGKGKGKEREGREGRRGMGRDWMG